MKTFDTVVAAGTVPDGMPRAWGNDTGGTTHADGQGNYRTTNMSGTMPTERTAPGFYVGAFRVGDRK